MTELNKSVIKISQLVQLGALKIPNYQRPYKWTGRNIHQLFDDIQVYSTKKSYRLGTIVFHQDKNENFLYIVDGQQRTLTLVLAIYALLTERLASVKDENIKKQLQSLEKPITHFINSNSFNSDISKTNLYQNYQSIKRLIIHDDFTENHIDFLLNSCEVVTFTLTDLSEAFQFFDSQNSRGRDLDPHDLLKAYHLREFAEHEQSIKGEVVASWESLESAELKKLFAIYLYRIRKWALGDDAFDFGKDEINLFKGVNIVRDADLPYVKSLLIKHHHTDYYDNKHRHEANFKGITFPFQLDQTIINGRRFFEMIEFYQKQIKTITEQENNEKSNFMGIKLSDRAKQILKELNSYEKRYRTGDQYVRMMFDCILIYYIDKFGTHELSKAIEKIFVWSYQLRLRQYAVRKESINNHVLSNNLFIKIKNAILPSDFLSISLPILTSNDVKDKKNKKITEYTEDTEDTEDTKIINTHPLVNLFKDLKYYE